MVVHPVKSTEVPDVDFILKSPVATAVPGFADAFTEISTFVAALPFGTNVCTVNVISSHNDKDINVDVPSRGYKISSIDSDKDINVDVPSRGYSSVSLNNKDFKYLNEIADTKSDLNMN